MKEPFGKRLFWSILTGMTFFVMGYSFHHTEYTTNGRHHLSTDILYGLLFGGVMLIGPLFQSNQIKRWRPTNTFRLIVIGIVLCWSVIFYFI